MISWRNPTTEQADWDLDTYAGRVLRAIDVAREITGSPDVNTLGFCAGGILMTTVLNHLAATGDDPRAQRRRTRSRCWTSTAGRRSAPSPAPGCSSSPGGSSAAQRRHHRPQTWARSSAGCAPTTWSSTTWSTNWLMGEDPPVFDILAWNADGTNLPARLHEQFLDIFRHEHAGPPGAMRVLGTPVDLSRITVPTFVTGALTDHLTPWDGCYRTTAAAVRPEHVRAQQRRAHRRAWSTRRATRRRSYWTGGEPGPDPDAWRAPAERHTGSWWEAWAEWMLERSGDELPAPTAPGSADHPPLEPAPGSYVLDRTPA